MEFTHTLRYPVTADTLISILCDPQFIRSRFDHVGAQATVETLPPATNGARIVRTRAVIPSMKLPSAIRGFLPPEVDISIDESFTPHDDGSWISRSEVSLGKLPVTATICTTLLTQENETRREVSGELNVKIPFFGKKAEAAAVEHLPKIGEAEVASVQQWIAR